MQNLVAKNLTKVSCLISEKSSKKSLTIVCGIIKPTKQCNHRNKMPLGVSSQQVGSGMTSIESSSVFVQLL